MASYLVTGGAGFIGSHLVEELVARGEQVRVLDNFSTGKHANLAAWTGQIDVINGDICDLATVRAAMRNVQFVLHQAALPSVPRSIDDPLTSNAVNVDGTLNVLWAAKEAGVQRVVYASSSSVYGNVPVSPKHEELTPAPASPYAVSKLTAEYYCGVFHQVYGLATVALRYFNVFGPRQDPDSPYAAVIPIFLRTMTRGEQPLIHGDGTQTRDFTFVRNVVQANLLACRAPAAAAGQAMNAACGDSISLCDLVTMLNELLHTNIAPQFGPPRPGDVKHSLADNTRAKNLLGYTPRFSFREGLAQTVQAFQKTNKE
jgi:UDP-glucose 4-epimerase